jgi:hypothetical protein
VSNIKGAIWIEVYWNKKPSRAKSLIELVKLDLYPHAVLPLGPILICTTIKGWCVITKMTKTVSVKMSLIETDRVFKIKMPRCMFRPKREKIIGGWRKLHNGELHTLYSSPNIIRTINPRRMKWVGHVECMGEKRNVHTVLVGKP